jgi:hypothetical protein
MKIADDREHESHPCAAERRRGSVPPTGTDKNDRRPAKLPHEKCRLPTVPNVRSIREEVVRWSAASGAKKRDFASWEKLRLFCGFWRKAFVAKHLEERIRY